MIRRTLPGGRRRALASAAAVALTPLALVVTSAGVAVADVGSGPSAVSTGAPGATGDAPDEPPPTDATIEPGPVPDPGPSADPVPIDCDGYDGSAGGGVPGVSDGSDGSEGSDGSGSASAGESGDDPVPSPPDLEPGKPDVAPRDASEPISAAVTGDPDAAGDPGDEPTADPTDEPTDKPTDDPTDDPTDGSTPIACPVAVMGTAGAAGAGGVADQESEVGDARTTADRSAVAPEERALPSTGASRGLQTTSASLLAASGALLVVAARIRGASWTRRRARHRGSRG
ncbi:PT domain-containing protein [Nocardioides sp. TRM66260-LWL]|uniref:PT domain-containing protein n=1 Tax=Nocardioides sp. TRM66260-LWL TaxID=2874478 RepID=UPI001CC6EDCA|nr:PT domain-containing protein [Nocardioides sp. TRM66260-LWL]MBZ5736178.1 PT domain-containing protein [Nocardioides sp. TRM66260-LWL]